VAISAQQQSRVSNRVILLKEKDTPEASDLLFSFVLINLVERVYRIECNQKVFWQRDERSIPSENYTTTSALHNTKPDRSRRESVIMVTPHNHDSVYNSSSLCISKDVSPRKWVSPIPISHDKHKPTMFPKYQAMERCPHYLGYSLEDRNRTISSKRCSCIEAARCMLLNEVSAALENKCQGHCHTCSTKH
jgi:hypothetical protein